VRRYGATAAAALGLFSVLQSSTLWAADGDWVTEIDEDGLKARRTLLALRDFFATGNEFRAGTAR
jgi:hypothetical protein